MYSSSTALTTTSTDTSTSAHLGSRAKDGSYYIIQKVFQDIAANQYSVRPASAAPASSTMTASKRPEKYKAPPNTVQPNGHVVMGGKVLYPLQQQFPCPKNTIDASQSMRKASPLLKSLAEQKKQQQSLQRSPSRVSAASQRRRQCSKVAEIKDLFENLTLKEHQLNQLMTRAPQSQTQAPVRRRRTPAKSSSSVTSKLNAKSVASNAGVDRSSSRTSYPAIDIAKLRKKFIAEAWQQKITSAKKVLEGILENLQKDESYSVPEIPAQQQQQQSHELPASNRISRRKSKEPSPPVHPPTTLSKQKKPKMSTDKQRKIVDLSKCDSESVLPDANKLQLYEEAMSKWENPDRTSSEIYRHSIKLKRKFANTQLNPEAARQQQEQQQQQTLEQQQQQQFVDSIQKLIEQRLQGKPKKQSINSHKMNVLPTTEPPVAQAPPKPSKNSDSLPFGISYTKLPSARCESSSYSSSLSTDPAINQVFNTLSTQALMQTSILSKLDNIESVVHSWQQTQRELMVLKDDNSRLKEQVKALRDKLEMSNALLRKLYFSTVQNNLRGHAAKPRDTVITSASMTSAQNRQVIMQLLDKWAKENVSNVRPRLSAGASEDQTSGGAYVSLSDSG